MGVNPIGPSQNQPTKPSIFDRALDTVYNTEWWLTGGYKFKTGEKTTHGDDVEYSVMPKKAEQFSSYVTGEMVPGEMMVVGGEGDGKKSSISYTPIKLACNCDDSKEGVMTSDGKIYVKAQLKTGQQGIQIADSFISGAAVGDQGTFIDSGLVLPPNKRAALLTDVNKAKANQTASKQPPVENKPNITAAKGEPKTQSQGDSPSVPGAYDAVKKNTKELNDVSNLK